MNDLIVEGQGFPPGNRKGAGSLKRKTPELDKTILLPEMSSFAAGYIPYDVRLRLVRSVDFVIRQSFPRKYTSLCHVYSIVGSNVLSSILGSEYRPVAGLAVFDYGRGHFASFADNSAFARGCGGAYHSWIESCPPDAGDRELVDIPFIHNKAIAKSQKIAWQRNDSGYLWGRFNDHVIDAELYNLPRVFPDATLWIRETPEGMSWLNKRIVSHMTQYVNLTAAVLRNLRNDPVFQNILWQCN